MKLPKFLYNSLKTHKTSLGVNEAFPPEKQYPFDYYIIKKRFNKVVERLISIEGRECLMNEDLLITNLTKYITRCKEIEAPIKDSLQNICVRIVSEMLGVPDEMVILNCKLVGEIKPSHSFRIIPEDDEDGYVFDDLSDFDNSNKVVLKRRLINSLIQGASYHYFSKYWLNEIYELNNELPTLYEKIRAINDYLLFAKEERISDKKPMQGACVEVELGRKEEKTEINVQALIFPYLFTETLRGFFELFASHGLPEDNEKAAYILKHADFLLAEHWDLRFGVELWNILCGDIEDTKILPYFISNISELPIDEFNDILKEIFAQTKKGNEIKQSFIEDAKHSVEMMSLMTTIDTKNKDIITDEFMNDDDIDNAVIEEYDSYEETNDCCRYDLDGNKADADRVIYDELDINSHWEDFGAMPFAWADAYDDDCNVVNKLIIGDEATTHGEVLKKLIINNVNAQISHFGEKAEIKGKFRNMHNGDMYYFMQCPKDEYMDEETGAIECDFEYSSYLIDNEEILYYPSNDEWEEYSGMLDDCGRVWIYDDVIAFWSTPTPMLMKSLIDDLQTELNIDLMDFYYVYYDDNENVQCCTIKEFIDQNNDNYTYKPDDRTEVGNHLLPSDKKKETEQYKNFLNNRNEKDGKKLGNMTMAQYHNLIHQESKSNDNKNIIKEGIKLQGGYDNYDYIDECFTYDELDKMFITEEEIKHDEDNFVIQNDGGTNYSVVNENNNDEKPEDLLLNADYKDIDFEEEQLNLNIPLPKNKYFWQVTPIINKVKIPTNLVNLKAESIMLKDKLFYQLHINVNPNIRNKGIGYKLYKAFINTFGNAISLIINRSRSFYKDNNANNNADEAIPKIWNKLKNEPNIKITEIKKNNEIVGLKAEIC